LRQGSRRIAIMVHSRGIFRIGAIPSSTTFRIGFTDYRYIIQCGNSSIYLSRRGYCHI
jgi:hypothetical protein